MDNPVRNQIVHFLQEELIGPASSLSLASYEEGFDIPFRERPRSRYGAGILFPQRAQVEDQNELTTDDIDTTEDKKALDMEETPRSDSDRSSMPDLTDQTPENDYEVTLANEFLPSAMGITALVDISNDLNMKVSGAWYRENKNVSATDSVNRAWQRIPFSEIILLPKEQLASSVPYEVLVQTTQAPTNLKVHVYSRPSPLPTASGSHRIITFTLVNKTMTDTGNPKDKDCYFQCSFSVEGVKESLPFLEYPESHFKKSQTEEEEELELLYRHRKVFAVGHGCSADWNATDGQDSCSRIETRVVPEYEVHPVFPASIDGVSLDMWEMGVSDKASVLKQCQELAFRYKDWIEQKTLEMPEGHEKAAERHLARCRECLKRIENGIKTLEVDETAYEAFSLMNRSMRMQDVHYKISSDAQKIRIWKNNQVLSEKYTAPDYSAGSRRWRPFQLAFILMSISSITDEISDERECVDLIWFPTGGGKTEAYLGLSAYTIFFRRLINPDNSGTTVLMRYTLRLLTTQQFQRAASLICAMESLRRKRPSALGTDPITIGLWVGAGVTPNKEASARDALNELSRRGKNVFVLTSCPWCGAQMGLIEHGKHTDIKGYNKLRRPERVRHICDDMDCEFSNKDESIGPAGLPVQIIDEHIYNSPPTLLIGTVDKFAVMPWEPKARAIFGIDTTKKVSPPDLIIQDEMHLISGPLGSMVGHYEAVIDALCEKTVNGKTIKPKVVASTATISNAPDQIQKLFGRKKYMLFPPQGLKAGDSFFAEERTDLPGRKYVGVFATGLPSQMTTMVRVMGALVQAPAIANADKAEVDPYWTQMVYFNSIRELGHALTLVRSDVPEYLNVLSNIRLKISKDDHARKRYIRRDEELTSRIPSDKVKDILDALFVTHQENPTEAIDICLATNMIQVGLDVPRLSLMVIAGQPKTTSEYIQASSRVGRFTPGLVFTVLNPGKPRDRSHYEHFRAYHQSFYKYVEPTSVTPFSVPVRERALHAIIITLIRYWGGEDLRKNPDTSIPKLLKDRILRVLEERVSLVDPDELDSTMNQVDYIWDEWEKLNPSKYGFMWGNDPDQTILMIPSAHNQFEDAHKGAFATPTSMRNVDASCEAGIIQEYEGI